MFSSRRAMKRHQTAESLSKVAPKPKDRKTR